MSSTTVAQHPTQPLNFGPEWLRALSTPESTTPISSAGGSAAGGGNIFKFATSKYRYSKDEILALRANVTERLAEDIRNEILGNLRDVESVFRPNIIEPLALTAPNADESAKMSSLSSYISGRTPGGGGGRGGGNAPQSQQQQHDSRNGRGGPNAGVRGGARGRGGRDTGFGPNRGNNHAEEGENGGGGGGGDDDPSAPSASWSTRGGYHSRGGASFGNRVRSYDDREPPFRRGGGPGTRQTSDTWRRSRGDEDEGNNEQNEDPSANTTNGSSSWSSRGGAARRGGSTGGSMDHRNKSNEKWSHVDDRSGPSGNFQSSQQRGWRPTTAMSDRDLNSRRPQPKQEHMPEWMDDGNDGDNPMSNATFEQDGTFTGSSSTRHGNNENDKPKPATQPSNEDKPAGHGRTNASKPHEAKKSGKTTPPQADTAVVNIPSVSETNVPKPTPPLQQPAPTWDDEFEPSDVATTVVEATLAEDHDYSPPVSSHPTPPAVPIIPAQRAPQPPPPVLIDDKQWFYKDPQHTVQGPFSSADMERWFTAGYFTIVLPVKRMGETHFSTIQQLTKELGRLPFRADAPSLPPPVQQPVMPEPQKFNPMTYAAPSSAAHNYIDDFLVQQQRQNAQNAMLFNRQTSVPLATADLKPVASPAMLNPQLQTYFGSQQQQHSQSSSSIFSPGLANDPAILYQQQPQLQRSTSVTNQQQALFDEAQRSFRHITSQPNAVSFFGTNIAGAQSQQPDDIMTRLAQAMQNHGQQQQEKIDEQRRLDQQRRELDIERLKLVQQAEQLRLQREEDERRQLEQQQKLEEEIRKKKEAAASNKQILDQMKEMAKTLDQKKPQPQPPQQQQQVKAQQPKTDVDQFLAFQQSLQYQKEQQAKIEAQKIENVRRYQQQQLREQSQPSPQQQQQQQQQQQSFKLPDSANWARHPSQGNDQNQPLNFAEIQRQEQEQERRAREAALSAQQLAKSETSNTSNPSSSSNSNKPGSWARTLFAGGNVNAPLGQSSTDPDTNEPTTPASPMTSYNQQATNAVLSLLNIHPKSRSTASQPSTPWSSTANLPNTSLQDIQRQQQQQSQSEVKPTTPQVQPQSTSSGHSTPAWGGVFQQPAGAASSQSSSSIFWADTQPTAPAKPSNATGGHKSSTPWSDVKPVPAPAPKSTSSAAEQSKSEREAKHLFTATRTQDALSKWAQTQFKDNLQAIDVPTLVQLLKDIDSAEEIVEYVQPYVGSVMKSKEFAKDFIAKRKQLANAGPEIDNDHLNELAMAPASSHSGSAHGGDEGFQLASSNGQKKKAKKMKGQKIDVKQLGFMVNNRPEQRDDIDRVQM